MYEYKEDADHSTHSAHDANRKRLWQIPSEESQPQNETRDTDTTVDRVVSLSRRCSEESRDAAFVADITDDYDNEAFEYEALTYFNLPRPAAGQIVIAVQAATISSLKTKIRKDFTIDNVSLDLDSGIAIVGVVREIGVNVDKQIIRVGDRVVTILKSVMKNARYAQVSANMVVKVPYGLDSAEAAAAAYTYLLGFQSLTHGIMNPAVRYSKCLFNLKSILITDGASTSGQAAIQLAITLGSKDVFATGPISRHELLKSLGAQPLTEQPEEWLKTVEGKMHVVIDTIHAKKLQCRAVEKALVSEGGRIIYVGCPITIDSLKYGSMDSWRCFFEQILAQAALMFLTTANATYYDLFSNLNTYPEKMKVSGKCFIRNMAAFIINHHHSFAFICIQNDLSHVLLLLAEGRIKPKISKYVNSDELAYGLVTIDPGSIAGSIICEPWKRRGPPREDNAKEGYTHMVRT